MASAQTAAKPGAKTALGLLLAINLFNYIDRQVLAAVEPEIRETFFASNDPNAMAITGVLGAAFLVSYMVSAPALGWVADRFSRWVIIGCAVILWSLASGGSGLAATFGMLFVTRIFVGIGEGGYGPAAPTILADLFPSKNAGRFSRFFAQPFRSEVRSVMSSEVRSEHTLAGVGLFIWLRRRAFCWERFASRNAIHARRMERGRKRRGRAGRSTANFCRRAPMF